jgi:hypothetical protein
MREEVPSRSYTHALKAAVGIAAIAALLAIAGCGGGGGSSAGPSTTHDKLASFCERTTDRDAGYCGCVADAVIKGGYDTDAEVGQIEALSLQATQTGNLSGLPAPLVTALDSCNTPTNG